jgi:hypothetical protein
MYSEQQAHPPLIITTRVGCSPLDFAYQCATSQLTLGHAETKSEKQGATNMGPRSPCCQYRQQQGSRSPTSPRVAV